MGVLYFKDVPDRLKTQFKVHCAKLKLSMKDATVLAITDYMKGKKRGKAKKHTSNKL